jgi:hypothetical protein
MLASELHGEARRIRHALVIGEASLGKLGEDGPLSGVRGSHAGEGEEGFKVVSGKKRVIVCP